MSDKYLFTAGIMQLLTRSLSCSRSFLDVQASLRSSGVRSYWIFRFIVTIKLFYCISGGLVKIMRLVFPRV